MEDMVHARPASAPAVDAQAAPTSDRDLLVELRAMVYDDAFHVLKRGAPGLSDSTRIVIASNIALRVYTHFQSEFVMAALGPSTMGADEERA